MAEPKKISDLDKELTFADSDSFVFSDTSAGRDKRIEGSDFRKTLNVPTIENVAELKTFEGKRDGQVAHLLSYTSDYKGGGPVIWDASSTETADDGMIFQVTGVATGRWKRPYEGYVKVSWYGIIPDGVSDNTDDIQYLCDNFRNIVFDRPSGGDHYRISSIKIKADIALLGGLPYVTFKKIGTSTDSMILQDAVASGFSHNVTLRDIRLLGDPAVNHSGIELNGTDALITRLQNVRVNDCGINGIDISNANVIELDGIWCLKNGNRGILLSGNDIYLNHIACEGSMSIAGIEASGQSIHIQNYHTEIQDSDIPSLLLDNVQSFSALGCSYGYTTSNAGGFTVTNAVLIQTGGFGVVRSSRIYEISGSSGTITFTTHIKDTARSYNVTPQRVGAYYSQNNMFAIDSTFLADKITTNYGFTDDIKMRSDGDKYFRNYSDNGTERGGMRFTDSSFNVLYGDTQDLFIRPNGPTSTTNQFVFSANGKLTKPNAGWETPFNMGTYSLWVDSTGDLRIKDGAPTSDTDGTVVGTQT